MQTILLCFICSSFAIVITTLKTKSSHNAILFPLAAPWVVITTTSGATGGNKVGIMTTLGFQCRFE